MMDMAARIAGLGNVMQLAYVPADIDAALAWWTGTMGAGPFFWMGHIACENVRYHDAAADIDFSMALGYWGDIQIELIVQHNDAPSIYKQWRDEGREGLHHVCIVVADLAEARRVAEAAGGAVVQSLEMPGGGGAIYVDAGGGPGTLVEMLCLPSYAGFDMMRDAARGWDGSDPVRGR
jgi:methylmalonyl-CoA/ethylmalonyl-CoA epimerase